MTTRVTPCVPPFPYFGGKRRAAADVWRLLGNVSRYVEPFFGSGAVLLGSPYRPKSELVNDRCGYIANVWRSIQQDPDTVERLASAPCDEVELKARHRWLYEGEGAERIAAVDWDDLAACDPEVAGVWLWAACAAIKPGNADLCVQARGVKALRAAGRLGPVRDRLQRVCVRRGDWTRCVTPAALMVTQNGHAATGLIGIFLDPPYGEGDGVHYEDGTGDVARDVWAWALANGDNPQLRIVVAGYDDGRDVPDGWATVERAEKGGYANQGENANRHRERLWASPHCVGVQADLFATKGEP